MIENNLTPPPELVKQIALQAIDAVPDDELDACCAWLLEEPFCASITHKKLRAARRPEPPSLKEQALAQLDLMTQKAYASNFAGFQTDTIRRAIEALPE